MTLQLSFFSYFLISSNSRYLFLYVLALEERQGRSVLCNPLVSEFPLLLLNLVNIIVKNIFICFFAVYLFTLDSVKSK